MTKERRTMQTDGTSLKRRSLLQRCLAVLAGGGAVAGIAEWKGRGLAHASERAPRTLTLYGRQRPIVSPHADRTGAFGELMDRPDGKVVGSFYTSCFCAAAPFGAHTAEAPSLEFQVMQLADGTLFGLGGGRADEGGTARALVGGTAKYAGASGSYIQRLAPGSGSHDVVEFVVTFAS
jgi:hypothetical protein